MQQVEDWLQKLGLGQYAQRFTENDIDLSVLPYLTDADLEKIGISLASLSFLASLPPKKTWPASSSPNREKLLNVAKSP
jgi:hypothetical protein